MGRRLRWTVVAAVAAALSACSAGGASGPASSSSAPVTPPSTSLPVVAAPSTPAVASSSTARVSTHPVPPHTSSARPPRRRASHGHALPLGFGTGSARQVVTVLAPSTGSTRGVLQAWRKVSGGWQRVGPAVPAWLGSDGLSPHPSESRSATPIGSFTLTQAFGHDPNPGTSLPYVHTTPADWWISQPGPLYNTRQRCESGCPFTRGDPNEHLYYETPYYDYAAVIDYNTANAPGGVHQGAGSAFFLHVTVGAPTAGCVSIAKDQLVRILRWLSPAAHPRIVIGVG